MSSQQSTGDPGTWIEVLGLAPAYAEADPSLTERTLVKVAQEAGWGAPGPVNPKKRAALLRRSAFALMEDGAPAEAVRLCAATGEGRPAPEFVNFHLRALRHDEEQGGPAGRLHAAVTEAIARTDLDAETRKMVMRYAHVPPPRRKKPAATSVAPLPGPRPGLRLDARLTGPDGLTESDLAAMRAALDAVEARFATEDRPPGLMALAARAARDLHAAGQHRPAALLASAAQSTPGGAKILLYTLNVLNIPDIAEELLGELAERKDLSDDFAEFVHVQRVKHRVALGPADHRQFWGPLNDDLSVTLANLKVTPPNREVTRKLIPRLFEIRKAAGLDEDPAEFARRFAWGHAAEGYLRFLVRARRPPREWQDADDETRTFQRLCIAVDDLHDDQTSVEMVAGRSIVVARAHAGVSCYFKHSFKQSGLPTIDIAANAPGSVDGAGGIFMSTRSGVQTGFLKLVKTVRKAPHLISIFPDGGYGGDLLEFDFMDARLKLGQGAATLAWHGHARTFFYHTGWVNGRVVSRLVPGPVVEKGMERAAFDAAFYAFYLDQLRDYVLGPPENMVANAGFWPLLDNA